MTTPSFGLVFNENYVDTLTPVTSDFSIVGLVLPSDDANAALFPPNVPAAGNSGDPTFLAALGTGPLYKAIRRINANLADLEVSAQVVVVRVPMGLKADGTEDVAATIANIVGDPAAGTGLYALLKAPQLCNITPRLIGAPGYTGQTTVGVAALVLGQQGQNFVNPALVFTPPGAAGTVTVAGGKVTGLTLTDPGDYQPGQTVTAAIVDGQGNPGAGATVAVTLQMLANPVCAALPDVLGKLLAHALVGGPGTNKAAAKAWRGTLNSPRLIPQDDWEIVADGAGTAYIDGAARSLGLAVRTDFEHGGYPFFSWANTPVQGALGLKRVDSFSLIDGATDGQELLAVGIGITTRGDLSDTALDDSGFIAVSYNNASSNPAINFYNKTRGRDFIDLALLKSIRSILGKSNVTPHAVQAVINKMTAVMIDLQSRECVVGYKIGFKAKDNSVAGLRAGKFTVFDNSEEPAPIVQITIDRALDADALASELATLAATGSTVAG